MATKVAQFHQPLLWHTPFYVGFSGNVDMIPEIVDYYMNIGEYKRPPKINNAECIVLTEDKKIFTFVNPTKWLQVNEKNYAVGSGSMFAIGAMEAGKTPLEAVKIASKKDPNTGLGFKYYKLK